MTPEQIQYLAQKMSEVSITPPEIPMWQGTMQALGEAMEKAQQQQQQRPHEKPKDHSV